MPHCWKSHVTAQIVFLFLKIIFVLANSVDPDEMLHYAAFHLDLHCLTKCTFRSHWYTKGLRAKICNIWYLDPDPHISRKNLNSTLNYHAHLLVFSEHNTEGHMFHSRQLTIQPACLLCRRVDDIKVRTLKV